MNNHNLIGCAEARSASYGPGGDAVVVAFPAEQLGALCEIASGGTPSRSKSEYFGGSIPWVKISDLLQGTVLKTEEAITRQGLENSAARLFPRGTVLISIFATIGRTAILGIDAATNQAIAGVTPRNPNQLDPTYLRHYFDATVRKLEAVARGVAQPNINLGILKTLLIPLPPLPEQRRIAAILDQADALRAKRREALAQLDSLTQSIFIEMFGDPATNLRQWPWKPLGSIASKFSDGPFGSNLKSEHYVEAGVRVVRLQNIGVGDFIDNDKAYISERHFESIKKHECRPGDILVGTMGDPNLRACILPNSIPLAINKADCVQIRVDSKMANSNFICGLINHPSTELLAEELKHGQTRVRISMGSLRGLEVPIPPVNLQNEFAAHLDNIKAQRVLHLKSLAELNALFASLQHRAFRGEL